MLSRYQKSNIPQPQVRTQAKCSIAFFVRNILEVLGSFVKKCSPNKGWIIQSSFYLENCILTGKQIAHKACINVKFRLVWISQISRVRVCGEPSSSAAKTGGVRQGCILVCLGYGRGHRRCFRRPPGCFVPTGNWGEAL